MQYFLNNISFEKKKLCSLETKLFIEKQKIILHILYEENIMGNIFIVHLHFKFIKMKKKVSKYAQYLF